MASSPTLPIVSDLQVKQPFTFNQIYSMMPLIKSAEYLCENPTGKMEWGSDRRGGKDREQQINRVRDGMLDRTESGMGPLEKLNTLVFLEMQINRIN